ncbi:hypothetical protein CH371_00195 [Leptospira wolffii]|uniref:Uncharacterized protein n=1 Tax=Leptospira wolffii TaxID=409998 RepID=A0A2M9ZDW8_9LEPT|nr:hypothetical protein CH371_00195 [Leptospira wolffii]
MWIFPPWKGTNPKANLSRRTRPLSTIGNDLFSDHTDQRLDFEKTTVNNGTEASLWVPHQT